jgi:glycosyltransferase involved in cell wall biosynthesis
MKLDLSCVVPLDNEDESLPELVVWIDRVCTAHGLNYEILLVNDGSSDRSWEVIQELAAAHASVKGLSFRRNQGKSAALHMGFQAAQGEVVITLDADLQDSPDEIPALVDLIRKDGFDVVSGWKRKRYDPLSKTLPTKLFNWATRKMSGIELNDFNCGLKAYRNEVVKAVEVQGEMHRYIPVLAKNAGFARIGEKVVEHRARKYGSTKFGLERFVNGFLDLLTLTVVTKFSRRPMHFFGMGGVLMLVVSFAALAYLGATKLLRLKAGLRPGLIADDPWFYISLTTLVLGMLLFLTGLLAELILRSSSRGPRYPVGATVRWPEND